MVHQKWWSRRCNVTFVVVDHDISEIIKAIESLYFENKAIECLCLCTVKGFCLYVCSVFNWDIPNQKSILNFQIFKFNQSPVFQNQKIISAAWCHSYIKLRTLVQSVRPEMVSWKKIFSQPFHDQLSATFCQHFSKSFEVNKV